jgi:Methyltransferase domain
MKQMTMWRMVWLVGLIVVLAPMAHAAAGPAKRGITGDWQVKVDFDGRQMTSILSLSKDEEGKLKGEWISFFGLTELSDLTHEGNELSFVEVNRYGGREMKTKFTGTIRRGKLSGTLSNDRGEYKAEGTRLRRVPMAAGEWDVKLTMGQREFTAVLTIKAGQKGQLTADWKSQVGEHQVSNVKFKAGKLTFDRTSKMQDRQWTSTFEGTIKAQRLTGVIKSDQGEITVEGRRVGAPVIGRWELEIKSDSGSRKQLLRIYPDLSAMYGPLHIDRIDLDKNKVAFKTSVKFGDRNYEISFTGRVKGKKLTGEITTSRGTREVTGQKTSPMRARRGAGQATETTREPDVIYVPTPQEVVDKMLDMAHVTKDDLVYDLGCGDGRIVVTAAKKYGCKAVGFDIDPRRIRESRANVKKNNVSDLVQIEQKDIFTLDLSKASVITLYLLPELNVRLIPQLEKLKPGSRIVSHDFDMRGIKPDKVVEVTTSDQTWNEHTIYFWTTPLKKEDAGSE